MSVSPAAVLFWLSAALLLQAFLGFPAAVALAARLRGRPVRSAPITPSVTIIIAAYNEEREIAARLDNALALDYPRERLDIIVASDGSTDGTEAIVERYGARRVRLLRLPRRGKIAALDAAVAQARGAVLVFTDANASFARDALRALVRNFADPAVGGVAGHSAYRIEAGSDSSSRGERLYWRYDSWLKSMESRTGSVVSAHGAFYALRRELYRTPADFAVTDDFMISTEVIARGRRLVFEPDARAYEAAVPAAAREFRRRVRLMTRGLRAVMMRRALLNPHRSGFYAFVLFSHKILRRAVPVFLLTLFAASLVLAGDAAVYTAAAAAQLAFYSLAVVGWLLRRSAAGHTKLLYLPFHFCLANAAALLALFAFLLGRRIELWQPQRHELPASSVAEGVS